MLPLSSIIVFMFVDAILVNLGLLASYYIKFSGNIPEYNLNGYQGLYLFITFAYLFSCLIFGLYKKSENLSYYEIIKKSLKTNVSTIVISLMFGYFLRSTKANGFSVSVFFIGFFIVTLLSIVTRIISKTYETNLEVYNKLVAFILNRIPEIILICFGIYLSYAIRFLGFNFPEDNFNAFKLSAAIISFSYIIFIYKFLLYKYSKEQSTFSVFFVMTKTSICSFTLASALLFIFREKIMRFPSSILIISYIINYFLLSFLHIIIRKGIISEIEVDLAAEPEEDGIDNDEIENLPPEKDGFIVYFWSMFKPAKFLNSIKEHGKILRLSSIILFFSTWWMILVYMCFMPDYIRSFFKKTPLGSDPFDYYLNNFRVFAITVILVYICYVIINIFQLKLMKKNELSKYLSGSLYVYGWNLILFLILILIGNLTNKIIFFTLASLIILWMWIINTKIINYVYNINLSKSIFTNFISLFITGIICFALLNFLY
jgi:hypothetical protein